MERGDAVDALRDERGDDEAVRGARRDVRDLDVELFPVAIEPAAARRSVHPVERDDRAVGEDRVEEQAKDAADGVFGAQVCERVSWLGRRWWCLRGDTPRASSILSMNLTVCMS